MLTEGVKTKLIFFFIAVILIITIIQLNNFFHREDMILTDFQETNQILVKNQEFYLKGEAKSIKKLFINNKEYFLDENDNFNIKLFLFQGYNKFNIRGLTKTNSEINKEIKVIYNK